MNYIKVTVKGKKPVIVLESNKRFYQKQDAKIETPTQAEIEAAFPEEAKKSPLNPTQENLQELTAEKLAAATAELEKANEALRAAQKEIEKLSKK